MIEARGITVDYGRSKPFDDLTLTFAEGSTAIMGPSGSGKSTLLRVLAGIQEPNDGTVAISGLETRRERRVGDMDPRVTFVFQDYRLVAFLDVRDNVRLSAEARGLRIRDSEIDDVLDRVGLSIARNAFPSTLSGGEQQRLAIARSLVSGAEVLLADEPTGALDRENSQNVSSILAKVGHEAGLTVVVATHDLEVAENMDQIVDLGALRGVA